MRVVALFRVSTASQATDGASLETQARRYDELAAANGWTTIAKVRGCESATGATNERRVWQQVREHLAGGECDAVYVHEQTRLTRGDELEEPVLRFTRQTIPRVAASPAGRKVVSA